MKLNTNIDVAAPVDRVVEVLCSPSFHANRNDERDEVVSTRTTLSTPDPENRRFEVHSTEYKRTRTGKLDRSRTEESVTRYRWNDAERALEWRWEGPEADRVDIHGRYLIAPRGQGTRVQLVQHIEVHVPLVGRKISRIIAGEFEKANELEATRLREVCEG